jgi:hypothetical protein
VIDFPATLPRPQRSSYALTVEAAASSTARDRATARCRRTGQGSRTTTALTWILTDAQFAAFAAWWRDDLQHGAETVAMRLPNGLGDYIQPVRFLAAYEASDLIGRWSVTAKAELSDPPRMTPTTLGRVISGELTMPLDDQATFDVGTDLAYRPNASTFDLVSRASQ